MRLDITTLSTVTKRLQELRKDMVKPQATRKRKRKDFLGLKSPRFQAIKSKKALHRRRGIWHRATGRCLAEREDNDRQSLRGLPNDESVSKATYFYRSIRRTASFDTAPKRPEECLWGLVQSRLQRCERLTVPARRRLMTWTWKGAGKVTHTEERPVSPGGTEYDH
ncbi:hypothetical protein IFR04_006686 [Cadophora malorum]|uniref:Uncharacterized protein n=1 Tax=Cadophora malorum TaxID=108018 RepID=A0A8H7TEM7_9HELO|nr:hypothetical protein IFR04_006686 [Cadophora malorum]